MQVEHKDLALVRNSDLFDADWYLSQYPDVGQLGMDPAEHFLKYGGLLRRDPSPHFSSSFHFDTRPGSEKNKSNPLLHYLTRKSARLANPKRVLWAAFNLAKANRYDQAVALAKENLPPELAYTLEILLANYALDQGNEDGWLQHFNNYLGIFDVEPITLSGNGHILGRFGTKPLEPVVDGPLVSVIMPAWNAEETVEYAANSILKQTWENIELLVVDDASQDDTWEALKRLASTDPRVKIFRNSINVGPYVSKNRALANATGLYVTGQDADDWAHPQRIEKHLDLVRKSGKGSKASLTHMVRVQPSGFFGFIGRVTDFTFDGVARKSSISCMFERSLLEKQLGYWDSVRFGADSEMIARTKKVLGDDFAEFKHVDMICLDLETSLTNHAEHGVDKVNGVSPIRKHYKDSWAEWHADNLPEGSAYLPFPLKKRVWFADPEMQVPYSDALKNLHADC